MVRRIRPIVATGKSETVAGYPCNYYKILDPNGLRQKDTRYCITSALGLVGVGMGGRMSSATEHAARKQFGNGYLVLKTRKIAGDKEIPCPRCATAPPSL